MCKVYTYAFSYMHYSHVHRMSFSVHMLQIHDFCCNQFSYSYNPTCIHI